MTSSTAFSFHAHVAEQAIDKVSRLFNATLDDILAELLQNARRAGATRVVVDQIDDADLGPSVRVADDGSGLANVQSLSRLGDSAWEEKIVNSEDAAGMGFFSLAGRGAKIVAQIYGTGSSWSIEATTDAFSGKEPVIGDKGPDGHGGVTIIFPERSHDNVPAAVKQAGRYYPLPVFLNGEEMERVDFLKDADHVEFWNGIRIGVYDHGLIGFQERATANFHGVTLHVPLPHLSQRHHRAYHARIDVIDCADMKLVLPARKEVVHDGAYAALSDAVTRLFFRLIMEAGAHSLSFDDYRLARDIGFELAEAAPLLLPFIASEANGESGVFRNARNIQMGAILYEGEGPLEEQNLANALPDDHTRPALYAPDASFVGYAWYDGLPTMHLKGYRLMKNDTVEDIAPDDMFSLKGRPDTLKFVFGFEGDNAPADLVLDTDVLILGPDYATLDDVDIRVVSKTNLTPHDLVDHLERALFCPSDDGEAGSYDQQREWFRDEAEDFAVTLLQSAEDADRNHIVRVIERELLWRLPENREITIRIDRPSHASRLPHSIEIDIAARQG